MTQIGEARPLIGEVLAVIVLGCLKKVPLFRGVRKKQHTVALSTCEAEYMALTYAIQEGKFLRQILSDIMINECKPINLFVDNRGSIDLAKNPVNHQRSKHIDIRYHYIRSEVADGIVILHHVASEDNVSDMFTKPVSKTLFQKFHVCY